MNYGIAPGDKYPAVNAHTDKLHKHGGNKNAVAKIRKSIACFYAVDI
jgi:hypothetical protein